MGADTGTLKRPQCIRTAQRIADLGVKATAIRADLSHDLIEKPLADCTEEDYDRIFDTNVKGVFFTLREAARRLNDGGRIIVSSTGGTKMFFPGQSLYLGSKGAVEKMTPAGSSPASSGARRPRSALCDQPTVILPCIQG